MGDADRTPEDVIAAHLLDEGFGAWIDHIDCAKESIAALTAAGYAVVPAADVDAAARLRAERMTRTIITRGDVTLTRLGDGSVYLDSVQVFPPLAAAAVGSVDPEGEAGVQDVIDAYDPWHHDTGRGQR